MWGGLVGISHNCTFDHVYSINSTIKTDGTYAGLLVGQDEGSTFTGCFTNPRSKIWACGDWTEGESGAAFCGGLCGDASRSTFTNCVNEAIVTAQDDYLGGIAGHGENTTFTGCINFGVVANADEDGYTTMHSYYDDLFESSQSFLLSAGSSILLGIDLGQVSNVIDLFLLAGDVKNGDISSDITDDATDLATNIFGTLLINYSGLPSSTLYAGSAAVFLAAELITVTGLEIYEDTYAADEVGGIVGRMYGGTVDRCSNFCAVSAQDEMCGGIAGYLGGSGIIRNSLNRGLTYATENVGGIAGYCDTGTELTYNINVAGVSSEQTTGNWGYITYKEKYTEGASTNDNYYVYGEDAYGNWGSYGVTPESFASGSIAKNLNSLANDTVWHQNLGKCMYPVPFYNGSVVTATTDTPCKVDKVYDARGFYIGVSNPWARLSLEDDIDLSTVICVNMSSETSPFQGTIEGNRHTISNLTYEVPYPSEDGNNGWSDVYASLFPYANGATFRNFNIKDFQFTQEDYPTVSTNDRSHPNGEALLVGHSTGCSYDSITIQSSAIYHCDEWVRWVGGMVAISNNDTFNDCGTDEDCIFQALTESSCNDNLLGGIAGKATNVSFTRCYNAAEIDGDDEKVGGIVGTIEGTGNVITHCLNTGQVDGHEYTGGIVGCAYNTDIAYCVNTGTLSDDNQERDDWRGGIAGCISGGSKDYCLNFGSINYAADNCGVIGQLTGGATDKGHSYYYCQYNGTHTDNESQYSDENSIYRWTKMLSGEFTYKATDADGNKWLYQDIDKSCFSTNLPNPIAISGNVYSNILCDGTQSYSNEYKSTAAHTGVADDFGYCTICGTLLGDPDSEIHIRNARELNRLANLVNGGADLSSSTVYLDNDINMNGYSFTPIGDFPNYPFKGTFNGQGHRIKNLVIANTNTTSATGTGVGLFGCVAGTSTIENLIVDKSCQITGSYYGTAGIVGCLALPSESSTDAIDFTMVNCGNEADITGNINAAGLVGGTYNTETYGNLAMNIWNCYNTGNIYGTKESAAFCGYARKNFNVVLGYNTGTVTGADEGSAFLRAKLEGDFIMQDCYDLSGTQMTGGTVYGITAQDITCGKLCYEMNSRLDPMRQVARYRNMASWVQDLGQDTHPTFGDTIITANKGLTYTRSLSNRWGTIVLPFDVTIDESEPYDFYEVSSVTDDVLTLTKITGTLSAGTPAILRMSNPAFDSKTNKFTYTWIASSAPSESISTPEAVDGLTLTGVYETNDITERDGYIISGNAFWNIDDINGDDNATKVYCSPFHVYLAGTVASGARCLSIGGEATGLTGTLDSRLSTLNSGKYLVNGRLVIIKDGKEYNTIGSQINR